MHIVHEHRYPWTANQVVSVALSGLFVIGLAALLAFASGKPTWFALAVLAPAASYWAWRTNITRKNASALQVKVIDGHVECESSMNDSSCSPVALSGINHVGLTHVKNRDVVVIAGEVDGEPQRQKIPARVFTPGNPVGPEIVEAARANSAEMSDRVVAVLLG